MTTAAVMFSRCDTTNAFSLYDSVSRPFPYLQLRIINALPPPAPPPTWPWIVLAVAVLVCAVAAWFAGRVEDATHLDPTSDTWVIG